MASRCCVLRVVGAAVVPASSLSLILSDIVEVDLVVVRVVVVVVFVSCDCCGGCGC